jgi:hypothetical protein
MKATGLMLPYALSVFVFSSLVVNGQELMCRECRFKQVSKPDLQEGIPACIHGDANPSLFLWESANLKNAEEIHYHADSAIVRFFSYEDQKQLFTYDAGGDILSHVYQNWQNNQWVNSWFDSYTYDTVGNLISSLSQEWQNNAWVNYWSENNTYDASGNLISSLSQVWQNIAWVNFRLGSYAYDASGNLLTYMLQEWQNNTWVNLAKCTFTYDSAGNRLSELWQQGQEYTWINLELFTFTYDTSRNLLTYKHQDWQNGAWENSEFVTNTYDANGNCVSSLYQLWVNNTWVSNGLTTMTYDAGGNLLTSVSQEWQNNAWVNHFSYNYTYDNQGNMLTELYLWWENNAWKNSLKTEYNYQAGKISANAYEWTGTQWIPYDNAYFEFIFLDEYLFGADGYAAEVYYSSYTGIQENPSGSASGFSIYPNPATGPVTLTFSKPVTGKGAILLYDLSGRLVKVVFEGDLTGSVSPFTFDAGSLDAGIYLLRVKSKEMTLQQKLIKVR